MAPGIGASFLRMLVSSLVFYLFKRLVINDIKKSSLHFDFASDQGLQRCGKSCRLRWTNYLRPDLKHGQFSDAEEQTIVKLHSVFGNRYITYGCVLNLACVCVCDMRDLTTPT